MLQVSREGAALHLVLDRPEVRNALDEGLIAALTETLTGDLGGARAVVLSGEGKAFCAGADLGYMRRTAGFSPAENEADAGRLAALFAAIDGCPVPTVALAHGSVFGGGNGLLAACDVAIAEEGTLFAFSEVRLGLIPATISPFVVRRIGVGAARSLFVTGEAFDAERALRIGLVQRVVPAGGLEAAVAETLATLARNGPRAMVAARGLALEGPLDLPECARRLAAARGSEEGREGLAAFLERRAASFAG